MKGGLDMKRNVCIGLSIVFLVISFGIFKLPDPNYLKQSGILSFYLLLIGLFYPFKKGND